MGLFDSLSRSGPLTDAITPVPARFEALAEALTSGGDVGGNISAVCAVTGRELARDGADMATALEGLRTVYAVACGADPDFAATHALCLAWSEETLGYLHQLSCEDPLTGLATLAHLRTRLTEIYRGVGQRDGSTTTSAPAWALVVVALPAWAVDDRFEHAMRLVRTAETVRLAFAGDETVAQVAANRLVVLTRRSELLGRRVSAVRTLLDTNVGGGRSVDREGSTVRVWIEGLPSNDAAAGVLLDELART